MSGYLHRLASKALQAGPQLRSAAVPFGADLALQPAVWPGEEPTLASIKPDLQLQTPAPLLDASEAGPPATPRNDAPRPMRADPSQAPFDPVPRSKPQSTLEANVEHPSSKPASAVAAQAEPSRGHALQVAAPSLGAAPTVPRARELAPGPRSYDVTRARDDPHEPLVRPLPASSGGPASVAASIDALFAPRRASTSATPQALEAAPASTAQRPRMPAQRAVTPNRERASTQDENTTVHVTIGRIEIAAVQPPAAPARPAAHGARPLSLDDYLARRGRR